MACSWSGESSSRVPTVVCWVLSFPTSVPSIGICASVSPSASATVAGCTERQPTPALPPVVMRRSSTKMTRRWAAGSEPEGPPPLKHSASQSFVTA